MRTEITITLMTALLFGCGEPYRDEGRRYSAAAKLAMDEYWSKNASSGPHETLKWNDCGLEVTCLYLYNTQDQKLVEAIVLNLLSTQAEVKNPGIKLTVYSSSHDEDKVVFREVTIKQ